MKNEKVVRLRPKWRKPLSELDLRLLRPYIPNVGLRGDIDDAVRRVLVCIFAVAVRMV